MKTIPTITLSDGTVTQLDQEDYEIHRHFSWYKNTYGYVCRKGRRDSRGYRKTYYLHREIMNAQVGEKVDHANGDRLDNRRSNLRFATAQQNSRNRRKRSGTSSQYKGVCWHKTEKRWYVSLKINYRSIHIGSFTSEVEAALAYNAKALEVFGEFACLNKIEGDSTAG